VVEHPGFLSRVLINLLKCIYIYVETNVQAAVKVIRYTKIFTYEIEV